MPERLTDNEGSLLGVVARRQPVTTYQLLKTYEASPVSSFNTSKGGVYKMVRRLVDQGLLGAESIPDDARNSEVLRCTDLGLDMLRAWVMDVKPIHTLVYDPLRTRLLSLDLLSRDERIAWIAHTRKLLVEKMAEVEAYERTAEVPYKDIAHLGAIGSLEGKIGWLDRLRSVVSREARGPRPTALVAKAEGDTPQ